MAWNPSPEVAAARDYGQKFGCRRVLILIEFNDGNLSYTSYGKTRELCDETKRVADEVFPYFVESVRDVHGSAELEAMWQEFLKERGLR